MEVVSYLSIPKCTFLNISLNFSELYNNNWRDLLFFLNRDSVSSELITQMKGLHKTAKSFVHTSVIAFSKPSAVPATHRTISHPQITTHMFLRPEEAAKEIDCAFLLLLQPKYFIPYREGTVTMVSFPSVADYD